MTAMAIVRRLGALLVLLVCGFGLVPAAAVAAARCDSRKSCPMMAKRGLPCHPAADGARGGMTAPMSCCEPKAMANAVTTPVAVSPAPAFSALPGDSGMEAAPELRPDWRQHRPTPELYTLHAVWRI